MLQQHTPEEHGRRQQQQLLSLLALLAQKYKY
jgi:hypothetical protein